MSHRLGLVITLDVSMEIGPDAGAETSPNQWEVTFPVDPLAKFVMLHLNGAALTAGDRVEVELGYDTDVYTSDWGPDFWTRPIRGDQEVTITYIRVGGGGGHVTLDKYGRGQAMEDGGATNTNADLFLMETPYAAHAPEVQSSAGKFPSGSDPTWENVACLPEGIMKTTARSVGMFVDVHEMENIVSGCSATLIAPDLIITAGHCLTLDAEAKTGAITFDFQTDCDGNRVDPYFPKFHKLKRVVKAKNESFDLDYCVIQIVTPPGGLGIPPIPFRPDMPPEGEPLFIIHHPRGAIKKVSRHPIDENCKVLPVQPNDPPTRIRFECDTDHGSSGSSIFDSAGQIVANLSWWLWGTSTLAIAEDLATATPPPRDFDVALVFDRSGSMSLEGFNTTETKLEQAQRAAALFISLLRTDKTHRAGLVTFSSTASQDFQFEPVSDPATKDALIGPVPPGTAGLIGEINAGGNTTIGGGIQTAISLFPAPLPTTNARTILLLTDGLHNTDPSVAEGEVSIQGSAALNIIGFGTDASLDGPGLTRLARDHRGIYWRAEEALSLKKYFALAFGNIFDFGVALDPQFFLPDGVMSAPLMDVHVCGETMLTAILGWDNPQADLRLSLISPGGSTITAFSPGVNGASANTWAHLRIPLPFAGEQDGVWKVEVKRPVGDIEFPPPKPALNFFVTTLVDGGPVFYPIIQPPLYTGDVINPLVRLSPQGGHLHAAVTVEIELPDDGTGNILTNEGLGAPGSIDGDALDARTKKLIDLEKAKGSALIPTSKRTVMLFDDGEHEDGAIEEDGIFGNPLADLTRAEGNYTFHAIATYGHDCIAQRETTWSVYVSIGIDPDMTTVSSKPGGTLPDGREKVCLTFTPRDRYGNYLGPGRAGLLQIKAQPGSQLDGALHDNGDGSYTQCIIWDPDSDTPPGVSIYQPGRPPVILTDPHWKVFQYVINFVCGTQEDCPCECAPVRPGIYATEINIHNPHEKDARIRKYVIPVVFSGAVIGREPRTAGRKAIDRIVLPPHTATMDDCCRIGDLLIGGTPSASLPLTIGILEIVSSVELQITAVYTVSDLKSGRVSIDVEQIKARGSGD